MTRPLRRQRRRTSVRITPKLRIRPERRRRRMRKAPRPRVPLRRRVPWHSGPPALLAGKTQARRPRREWGSRVPRGPRLLPRALPIRRRLRARRKESTPAPVSVSPPRTPLRRLVHHVGRLRPRLLPRGGLRRFCRGPRGPRLGRPWDPRPRCRVPQGSAACPRRTRRSRRLGFCLGRPSGLFGRPRGLRLPFAVSVTFRPRRATLPRPGPGSGQEGSDKLGHEASDPAVRAALHR